MGCVVMASHELALIDEVCTRMKGTRYIALCKCGWRGVAFRVRSIAHLEWRLHYDRHAGTVSNETPSGPTRDDA
jgi:hypothetical protein